MLAPLLAAASFAGMLAAQVPPPRWVRPELNPREAPFGVVWKAELGSFELLATQPEEWTHPRLSPDGARVYIGSRAGRLEARAMEDGELLWAHPEFGDIGSDMMEVRDTLVVGVNSDVVGLSRSLGTERWRVRVGGRIGGRLARQGSVVLVPVRPNGFVAIDAVEGERRWQVKRPTPDGLTVRGQAAAGIDEARGLAYLGFSDGKLMAVEIATGTARWQTPLGNPGEFFADIDATPLLIDQGRKLLAAAYNRGTFVIDPETGGVLRRMEDLPRISAFTGGGTHVLASSGTGEVLGLDPRSLKVRWRYRLRSGAPTAPTLVSGGLAAITSSRGPMVLLEVETGRPVQMIAPGPGASVPPAAVGRNLVLMSDGGLVLGLRRGTPGHVILR